MRHRTVPVADYSFKVAVISFFDTKDGLPGRRPNLDDSEGVVVGTSLNGIGKKISLIDHASPSDTREMIQLASRFL
jgi:hypothetical protein